MSLELPESDAELLRSFNRWNRVFHNGRLTSKVVLRWEPIGDHAELGDGNEKRGHRYGLLEKDEFYICIDPALRYSKCLWGLALHHEMAHLAVWPYDKHGAKWQREMLRLAQAGAFKKLW